MCDYVTGLLCSFTIFLLISSKSSFLHEILIIACVAPRLSASLLMSAVKFGFFLSSLEASCVSITRFQAIESALIIPFLDIFDVAKAK